MVAVDVAKTFGALLLGALFASVLSGGVTLQTIVYLNIYQTDFARIRQLVILIWFLDTCHTVFIWISIWDYLIRGFGKLEVIDNLHWSIAITIILTAILTFFVHGFFAHRIFMLSGRNWWVTAPVMILAVLRLASASVTTGEMLSLKSLSAFQAKIRWVFTLGLALSSSVDVYITFALFWLLHQSRAFAGRLKAVIDSLMLYTFETGSLTSAATIISMLCWLVMPTNLIFMGLHFGIGKLYATSLLVTLNARRRLAVRDGPSEVIMDLYSAHPQRTEPALVLTAARGHVRPDFTTISHAPIKTSDYTIENRSEMYTPSQGGGSKRADETYGP